jgi:putative colanic acid biosynthesis UDP-glucose lipid carrier transferase
MFNTFDMPRGLGTKHAASMILIYKTMDAALIALGLHLSLRLRGLAWDTRFLLVALVVFIIYYIYAHFNELYRSWRGKPLSSQLRSLLFTWTETGLTLFGLGYALKTSEAYSRLAIFSWLVLVFVFLACLRIATHVGFKHLRSKGRNTRTVAVVGSGPASRSITRTICSNPWLGLRFVGFYGQGFPSEIAGISSSAWKLAGTLDDLVEQARQGRIEQIFLCSATITSEELRSITSRLADTTASIYVVPDTLIFSILHGDWADFAGIPAIRLFDSPFFGINVLAKKIEDMVLAALILLIIAVPMCVIAVTIKLTSKGPVLFKQQRYGLKGENIIIWKFRTMTVCQDGDHVPQACRNDPRVTRMGAFLRSTSLDELPQFINVLQGRMSIVGPRPHAVAHNEFYRSQIFGYMLRHKIKPGITGWAQINGWRGETDSLEKMQKRIEYDLWYIQNWSLWLDIKIILMTLCKGFWGKNAF